MLWTYYHFVTHYWKCKSYPEPNCLQIRRDNLLEITSILNKYSDYWLFGSTLKSLLLTNKLDAADHDDDIGIWKSNWDVIFKYVIKDLTSLGWQIIRQNEHIVSFLKNGYYVDICIFRPYPFLLCGYGNKLVPSYFFKSYDSISFHSYYLKVPLHSKMLLDFLYSRRSPFFLLNTFYRYYNFFSDFSNIYSKVRKYLSHFLVKCPHRLRLVIAPFLSVFNIYYKKLSIDNFLDLDIEAHDSFNWYWRSSHLAPLTNNCTLSKNYDIIQYLKSPSTWEKIQRSTVDVDTSEIFSSPLSCDYRFWTTGNNFFTYCVLFSFRHNVCSYSNANYYIRSTREPLLYSYDYYSSLSPMTDSEIIDFIRANPIEITNNSVSSGKHRC